MPVARKSKRSSALTNLARAEAVRLTRSLQRRALRGASPQTLIPVLIDPPTELASYRLRDLFASKEAGVISQFGDHKLKRLLTDLNCSCRARDWHDEIRLRDLSKSERRALASALLRRAPQGWREA